MSLILTFQKWHGLGNDFVLIDQSLNGRFVLTDAIARKLGDRHFGVGCDQILHLVPSEMPGANLRMDIRNSDGTVAGMCGNGIRAAALYWAEKHKIKDIVRIESAARVYEIVLVKEGARVDMGPPRVLETDEHLQIAGADYYFTEVSMGNPHAVIFQKTEHDFKKIDLADHGPLIENHKRFPHRTNVEWVWVKSEHELHMRVWERGAGITLACGTGACAAAVAAIHHQQCKSPVAVHLPGGVLKIEWSGEDKDSVFMQGPATFVYEGSIAL